MFSTKYFTGVCLIVFLSCTTSQAQGLKNRLREAIRDDSDRDNQRLDFEGAVWEYKIMDRKERDKSKQTHMIGRVRIKQSAVFAVGDVKYLKDQRKLSLEEQSGKYLQEYDRNGDKRLNEAELAQLLKSLDSSKNSMASAEPGNSMRKSAGTSNGVKEDFKGLLSQRIKSAKEDGTGSERIGDVSKQGGKVYLFKFDQDDTYPLSGRAELRPDTDQKGGVWYGNYDEYVSGKKQSRWRIELRKIDE